MSEKRGQGEGSIFANRWVASLSLGFEVRDGKRRRVRKKFAARTRGEVQRKLTAALRNQQQGLPVPMEKETFGTFLQRWLDQVVIRRVAESTLHSYRWLIEKHIEPDLGSIQLAKLTPEKIDAFVNAKLAAGLSPRTAQYCHALVRNALTQAERWALVARNAASWYRLPNRRNPKSNRLSLPTRDFSCMRSPVTDSKHCTV